jgi:hypothetical protein
LAKSTVSCPLDLANSKHFQGAAVMEQKWTYGLWGAALGAGACMMVGFTWGGWSTSRSATAQAEAAAWTALVPVCADTILANPEAVAALKTKRPVDYDDVVRDFLKTIGNRTDINYAFRRDCGKAIESKLTHASAKS